MDDAERSQPHADLIGSAARWHRHASGQARFRLLVTALSSSGSRGSAGRRAVSVRVTEAFEEGVAVGSGVGPVEWFGGGVVTQRLCRLHYSGYANNEGFAIYGASHDDYEDSYLPTGTPVGTAEDALDCACGLYLNDPTTWI